VLGCVGLLGCECSSVVKTKERRRIVLGGKGRKWLPAHTGPNRRRTKWKTEIKDGHNDKSTTQHYPTTHQTMIFTTTKKLMMKTNLCLIGPPGSGKGSYGKYISKAFNLPIYSTSELLKRHGYLVNGDDGDDETTSSQQQQQQGRSSISSGKLVDDSIVCQTILKEFQSRHQQQHIGGSGGGTSLNKSSGYILDGFPRTARQIKLMEELWPPSYHIHGAIKLAVPDIVCEQKLLGRRLCMKCGGNYNIANAHWNGWNLPAYLPSSKLSSSSSSSPSSTQLSSPPSNSSTTSTSEEQSSSTPSSSSFSLPSSLTCCDPTKDWMTRDDDRSWDVVEHRLQVYHSHMDPILDYFDRRGQLLKLSPYNGFDDLPQIIETVENWIQSPS
jgi:adenylate kinase family enzyme